MPRAATPSKESPFALPVLSEDHQRPQRLTLGWMRFMVETHKGWPDGAVLEDSDNGHLRLVRQD